MNVLFDGEPEDLAEEAMEMVLLEKGGGVGAI
jgi:hypothetical protein